jgi:thioredoxin-like negative regulator of GroEL
MIHLALNILLQAAALSAGAHDYATAYKQAEENGQPLVLLIGADWCPGCQQMKYTTIPELERKGGLRKVAFAYVNTDQESALARKLMRGGSIPQLVVYRKTDDGWKRKQLTGAQSTGTVETFLAAPTQESRERLSAAPNKEPSGS